MTDQRCSRQRQHSASANFESSYSGSSDESSYSASSDKSLEESTCIIPDPTMSWYPPGSLPSTSSTYDITADCTQYDSQENDSVVVHNARNANSSFNLDDSQKAAVLSCLDTRECHHQISVKLIWGPPRTRKTKTVGSLLFVLFRMKFRTLTCAPTNIAVLGVATRLMSLVRKSFQYDTYGLGDIVLFCNWEKAKIDDHEDLIDVFLDYCISILASCFALMFGWNNNVESMICLLEDAELLYQLYLEKEKTKNYKNEDDNEEDEKKEIIFGIRKVNNNQDNEGSIYDQDLKDTDKIKKKIRRRQLFKH
ncbi:hypothetical protein LOK49_LG05G02319 [Camellia lanceoleosa]|uniref:Uncharacterized protein n=1 Tax=Camellia lanceoleosa TaxID=1840588 RepID=A0ACC0HML8_9ERIC|nr:hypothetical protein LOK49_LG05G02319 [Camellia lanceoleosa]